VRASDSEAGYFARLDSTTHGVARFRVTDETISADFLRSGGGSFTDSFSIG
jgi:hypothetical protein